MSEKLIEQAEKELKQEDKANKVIAIKQLIRQEKDLENAILIYEGIIETLCIQIDEIREKIGSIKAGNYSVIN